MSSGTRINYPGREFSPNVSAELNIPIENKITRFVIGDDVRDWRAIPKKLHDYGSATKRAILVPYCPYTENQYKYYESFHRNLYLNVQNTYGHPSSRGLKKPIPIVRPQDHDAYIHSISWMAFDYNEPLPYVDIDAIVAELQVVNPAWGEGQMLVTGAFLDSLGYFCDGHMIAIVDNTATALDDWTRSTTFTTAHVPDMAYGSTAAHLLQIEDNYKINQRLSEAAPRTNALKGMLPTDWAVNMFHLAVGTYDGTFTDETDFPITPDAYIYDSRGRLTPGDNPDAMSISEWDLDGAGGAGRGIGADYPIPIINNQLNIKIPNGVDFLTFEVDGPGWFLGLEVKDYPNAVKGYNAGTGQKSFRTLCQMPVRVIVDILYYPQS